MDYLPTDQSFSAQSSPSLQSSSTPMPNRRLFVGPHDPPTLLSKHQYMALAFQHIQQTHPNLPHGELATYISQTEQAYNNYIVQFPPTPFSPPVPSIPHGFGPPSTQHHQCQLHRSIHLPLMSP